MVTHDYQTHLFLNQNRLKRYIKDTYNIIWSEYLILLAVNKIEEIAGLVATSDVIDELQLDRAWTYNAVNKLKQKNYLEISKSKNPWIANSLSTSIGGRIILTGAENHIKQRVSD